MGKVNLCILLLVQFYIISQIQCTDWCNIQQKYCADYNKVSDHIGCKPNQIPKGNCQNVKLIPIDEQLKQVIVNSHNVKRDTIASGTFNSFPYASRMAEMSWDEDLEILSKFHVQNCQMQHDKCRATEKFHYAGQNLAMIGSTGGYPDKTAAVKQMIMNWFNEYVDTPTSLVKSFNSDLLHKVGHFTVMMREKNTNVGCGLISYESVETGKRFFNYMLTCDYADTNMLNEPLYDIGAPTSKCMQFNMVKSPSFSNLCVMPNQILGNDTLISNNPIETPTTTTTKTTLPTKIMTFPTIKAANDLNAIYLSKLRVIFLNGNLAPTNMWPSVQEQANKFVKACEVSPSFNMKMFISSSDKNYESFVHNKISTLINNLGGTVNLINDLKQKNMFYNFSMKNANVGCLYIIFDLSDNIMMIGNNNPITCIYAEDTKTTGYCQDCKKFTVKCWKQNNTARNYIIRESKFNEFKKSGRSFNNLFR